MNNPNDPKKQAADFADELAKKPELQKMMQTVMQQMQEDQAAAEQSRQRAAVRKGKTVNVVVLGAGFSGVLTAQHLAAYLKDSPSAASITILDQNPFHTMKTEIHAAATGRGKAEHVTYNLLDIFRGTGVHVIQDTVSEIDYSAREIKGQAGTYPYDFLVMSAGSKPTYFGIPGAEEYTWPLWTYQNALDIRDRLRTVFEEASRLNNPADRRARLTFYVIGAGLTGVEMAGELAEYLPLLEKAYRIDPAEVTLTEVDAMPRCLPNFPEHISDRAASILTGMGVDMKFGVKVQEVTKDTLLYEADGETKTVPTGMVIWTAGITANDITAQAGGTLESGKGGRLKENASLQSVTDPRVFVVGDNMYYTPGKAKTPVPQMVENCEQSSKVAARNIARLSKAMYDGRVPESVLLKSYHPHLHGAMISLGAHKGISYAGIGNAKITLPSVMTQLSKRAVNVLYLAPVVGFDKLPSLLAHEFFARRTVK